MPPSEAPSAPPAAWLLGRALEWQVTAAEMALAAPLLAWRTGLALAGGWAAAARPATETVPPSEAAPAEEVDDLA